MAGCGDDAGGAGRLDSVADLREAVAATRAAGPVALTVSLAVEQLLADVTAEGAWDFAADEGVFVVSGELDTVVRAGTRWIRPVGGGTWEADPVARYGDATDQGFGPWPGDQVSGGPDALHVVERAESVTFVEETGGRTRYDATLPPTADFDCRTQAEPPCVVPEPAEVTVDDQGRVVGVRLVSSLKVVLPSGEEATTPFVDFEVSFDEFGAAVDLPDDLPPR